MLLIDIAPLTYWFNSFELLLNFLHLVPIPIWSAAIVITLRIVVERASTVVVVVELPGRSGKIGIGGLGHLALQFLRAWGCEVVAFSSTASKADEAKKLGAHRVVDSKSDQDMTSIAGSLNFIISTANADLDWQKIMTCLAPKGRLHFVGAVPGPVSVQVFPMIVSQASISASPLGSPATTARMLEFCVRHKISPVSEYFKMSQVNEALEHLEHGKARYRIILKNDL